jgi:hypothetical protein
MLHYFYRVFLGRGCILDPEGWIVWVRRKQRVGIGGSDGRAQIYVDLWNRVRLLIAPS